MVHIEPRIEQFALISRLLCVRKGSVKDSNPVLANGYNDEREQRNGNDLSTRPLLPLSQILVLTSSLDIQRVAVDKAVSLFILEVGARGLALRCISGEIIISYNSFVSLINKTRSKHYR